MINDSRRLQNSTAISSGVHAGVFALYLFLRASTSQDKPVITHVEFLDLRPPAPSETAATPGPAQRAPKSLTDFFRMALPQGRADEPQEAKTRDMPLDKQLPASRAAPASSIKLDQRNLSRGASIQLKTDAPSRESSAAMSDVGAKARSSASVEMTAPGDAPKPAINLEAVGRKAVRGGSPAIRLDGAAPSRAGSSLSDISAPSGPRGSSQGLADAGPKSGISISEGGGPKRQGKISSLPTGYGGGGGGISLSTKPGVRGGGGGLAMPAPAAPPAPTDKLQNQSEKTRHKGFEISGPLSHRKIIMVAPPGYPEWAKQQGIEAEVAIRFFVSSDGHVLERMLIERTSGYKEIDDVAMQALKKWVFAALDHEEADQWGIVTFRFKLK